ncbi:hypothetical protein [Aurantibacillus circumpalustris]|uniref:hypothetical protein n=1 Tax=Aurantibacillus circumpalustris TaxID=3036359 RepID=UPI00295A5CF1|nr:hypothetical protein [Aurantibacillus circumpalustris]
MQAADLIKYINNPKLLDKASVPQLQKLVNDFPYFQSAHILLSMASKKWDASVYQQSLKKTAIVATNRAHLFRLIHQIENEVEEVVEEPLVKESPKLQHQKEDVKQELDILRAAEVSTESEDVKPETKQLENITKVKPVLDAEQILEREIGNEVVNSFVEKEILKTNELNKPKVKEEEPENFGDWLSYLKKNNGQTYEEITEQVEQEIAKQESAKKEQPVAENKEEQAEKVEAESRKLKNRAIIDKIIETSPGLIRQKEEQQRFYAPDIKAKESLLENEHLVTETLAKIYALQGSINKAIRAYEILSIKYPQKRAYFDGLIQKLKTNG